MRDAEAQDEGLLRTVLVFMFGGERCWPCFVDSSIVVVFCRLDIMTIFSPREVVLFVSLERIDGLLRLFVGRLHLLEQQHYRPPTGFLKVATCKVLQSIKPLPLAVGDYVQAKQELVSSAKELAAVRANKEKADEMLLAKDKENSKVIAGFRHRPRRFFVRKDEGEGRRGGGLKFWSGRHYRKSGCSSFVVGTFVVGRIKFVMFFRTHRLAKL